MALDSLPSVTRGLGQVLRPLYLHCEKHSTFYAACFMMAWPSSGLSHFSALFCILARLLLRYEFTLQRFYQSAHTHSRFTRSSRSKQAGEIKLIHTSHKFLTVASLLGLLRQSMAASYESPISTFHKAKTRNQHSPHFSVNCFHPAQSCQLTFKRHPHAFRYFRRRRRCRFRYPTTAHTTDRPNKATIVGKTFIIPPRKRREIQNHQSRRLILFVSVW